ncbi:MAG: hypothetical protein HY716_11720 [Planctomycetes bacterium]|nr:hypothetical protein [Planctomycetota bacterium]
MNIVAGAAEGEEVRFEWTPSIDPQGSTMTYEIEVATELNFQPQDIEAHAADLSATRVSLFLSAERSRQVKYWRVKGWSEEGISSDWSTVASFRVEAPKVPGEGDVAKVCGMSVPPATPFGTAAAVVGAVLIFAFASIRRGEIL